MAEEKKPQKRGIHVPEELHKKLKLEAVRTGTTLEKLVTNILTKKLRNWPEKLED